MLWTPQTVTHPVLVGTLIAGAMMPDLAHTA